MSDLSKVTVTLSLADWQAVDRKLESAGWPDGEHTIRGLIKGQMPQPQPEPFLKPGDVVEWDSTSRRYVVSDHDTWISVRGYYAPGFDLGKPGGKPSRYTDPDSAPFTVL